MVDIKKIASAFEMGNDNIYVFLDLDTKDIVVVDEESLRYVQKYNYDDRPNYSINENILELCISIIENYERFIPIMPLTKDESFDMRKDFIEEITDNDIKAIMLNNFKGKGAFSKFNNDLDKYNLRNDFYKYKEDYYLKLAELFIIVNGLNETPCNDKDYKKLFDISNSILELKPWKHFADMDNVIINTIDKEYAYTILGYSGKCYGIEIFEDTEKLLIEKTIAQYDDTTILPMGIKNGFALYYDPYDELGDADQKLIEKYYKGISEDTMYPSFLRFEVGKMPASIRTQEQLKKLIAALEALKKFLVKYTKNPIDFSDEENYVKCTINNNRVQYKLTDEIPEPDYLFLPKLDMYKIVEFKKNVKIEDSIGYFELVLLPFIVDEECHVPFLSILYNDTFDRIEKHSMTTASYNDYETNVAKAFMNDLKDITFPNKIYTKNPLSFAILKMMLPNSVEIIPTANSKIDEIVEDMLNDLKIQD